ncbi:MAG TPA: hypothetical protein VFY03_12385 [Woeseiaceae bacterium]|nr:hypothetical protein [Woeseiaceae bacterium]
MPAPRNPTRRALVREVVFDLALVLAGILLLPVAIYLVGGAIFGTYAGDGFGAFFGALAKRLGNGNPSAWLLVLAPLLSVLLIRAAAWAWRTFAVAPE